MVNLLGGEREREHARETMKKGERKGEWQQVARRMRNDMRVCFSISDPLRAIG